jgi:catechol-2,3-dioxygenase
MNITAFGRAALKVRNLGASERFYAGALNMPVLRRAGGHEVGLQVGASGDLVIQSLEPESAQPAPRSAVHHIAFIVGNTPAALEAAARRLEQHDVFYERAAHAEFESLYCRDPDGHLIELYYWPSW